MTNMTTGSSLDCDRLKELFIKYDLNRNGVIDKNELLVAFLEILKDLGEEYPERKNQEVAEECLETFDVNRNQKLEFSEFYSLVEFLVNEKGYQMK